MRDLVEGPDAVGDDAGEHVEAARRALWIGGRVDCRRQRQTLEQRHDIDAARLEYGALTEADRVKGEIVELGLHSTAGPRQEARPHAISDWRQA